MYPDNVSRMYTTPHSLQSFIAVSNFWTKVYVNLISGYPFNSEQMHKEATALETTVALPSFRRFYNNFKNPC
jgi:hypothetical protein